MIKFPDNKDEGIRMGCLQPGHQGVQDVTGCCSIGRQGNVHRYIELPRDVIRPHANNKQLLLPRALMLFHVHVSRMALLAVYIHHHLASLLFPVSAVRSAVTRWKPSRETRESLVSPVSQVFEKTRTEDSL